MADSAALFTEDQRKSLERAMEVSERRRPVVGERSDRVRITTCIAALRPEMRALLEEFVASLEPYGVRDLEGAIAGDAIFVVRTWVNDDDVDGYDVLVLRPVDTPLGKRIVNAMQKTDRLCFVPLHPKDFDHEYCRG